MADEEILTDESAIALVAAEDTCLIMVELVAKKMVWA